nr:4089_t:CDS:2 [Entrophospora candida]CAG8507486.1 15630_t:CDS:2 [Entrophospora candida]
MADQLKEFVEMPKQFVKEGTQFVNRCTKPDQFIKISQAVAMGFFVMGFIGFFVKLVHIPINNILVYVLSSSSYNKSITLVNN